MHRIAPLQYQKCVFSWNSLLLNNIYSHRPMKKSVGLSETLL